MVASSIYRSVGEEVVLGAVDANLDGHVWAGNGAKPAPDTAGLIQHGGVEIALRVEVLAHSENLLWTGEVAELATFALILMDNDLGHTLNLP
jgi:hypothetical protein